MALDLSTPCPTCTANPGRVLAPYQPPGQTVWEDCPTCGGAGVLPTDAGREVFDFFEAFYDLVPKRRGV